MGDEWRKTSAFAVVGLIAVALAAAVLFGEDAGKEPKAERLGTIHGMTSTLPEETPPYPDEWIATASDVVANDAFAATLPEMSTANSSKATAYYVWPGGDAVAVTYPLVSEPTADVRQDYIEVWQAPRSVTDPDAETKEVLASSGIAGASLVDISGVPVIAVAAHSESDPEGRNPSLLWFIVDGIQYQVSGGDNLQDLVAIAEDAIGRASGK